MIVPIIVGLGIASIFRGGKSAKQNRYGQMTPERTNLFQAALNSSVLTSDQLQKLANGFAQEGRPAEADLLQKRARLRGQSPEEKRARSEVFRKALASKDPDAVERIASIYEMQGATGSARRLRMHAISLRTARNVPPAPPPAPPQEAQVSAPATAEVVAQVVDDSNDSDEPVTAVEETEADRTQLK